MSRETPKTAITARICILYGDFSARPDTTKLPKNRIELAQPEYGDLIPPKPWTDQREQKENQI